MGFITLRNLAKKDKYFIVMEDNIGSGEMSYSSLINKKGTDKEYRQTFKLIK